MLTLTLLVGITPMLTLTLLVGVAAHSHCCLVVVRVLGKHVPPRGSKSAPASPTKSLISKQLMSPVRHLATNKALGVSDLAGKFVRLMIICCLHVQLCDSLAYLLCGAWYLPVCSSVVCST